MENAWCPVIGTTMFKMKKSMVLCCLSTADDNRGRRLLQRSIKNSQTETIQDFETPQNLYVFATYYTNQRKNPILFFISSLCFFRCKSRLPRLHRFVSKDKTNQTQGKNNGCYLYVLFPQENTFESTLIWIFLYLNFSKSWI